MLYHRSYPAALHIFRGPRATRFVRESKDEELFAQALKLSIEQQAHDTEKYGVHNFSNLLTHISSISSLSNKWMAFCSGSELYILMPKLQGHTISIEMRLLVSEDMSIQGFWDNVVIPLSIHMLTDTREIELLFEEIDNYSYMNLLQKSSLHLSITLKKLLPTQSFNIKT